MFDNSHIHNDPNKTDNFHSISQFEIDKSTEALLPFRGIDP